MTSMLESYVAGSWYRADDDGVDLPDAVTGNRWLDCGRPARTSAPRSSTPERSGARRCVPLLPRTRRAGEGRVQRARGGGEGDELYALSTRSGATRRDSAVDIDAGIGILAVYASKGRKELTAGRVIIDGAQEPFGRGGTFACQHLRVPLTGVAVQINAYNFPVWGPAEAPPPSSTAAPTPVAMTVLFNITSSFCA